MLDEHTKKIIEINLKTILYSPESLNQQSFVETYNAVYSFCSVTSETFYIEGEDIYNLISTYLQEFSKQICFIGNISGIFQQSKSFYKSAQLITSIYRYLERFYISSLLRKNKPADNLIDLFFKSLYYNYIFQIESNLLNLIFLEIETARKNAKHDCSSLKGVVSFYIDLLSITGQEESLKAFYRSYINNFCENTNFSMDINKLVKRIYLEMFFVSNIIGNKSMCKSIVERLNDRKEDVLKHCFLKIEAYENFKHIYKIIGLMEDQIKNKFKKFFTKFISEKLKESNNFNELFTSYVRLRTLIIENKVFCQIDSLKSHFKEFFIDRNQKEQEKYSLELIAHINEIINEYNTKNDISCSEGNLLDQIIAESCCNHALNRYSRNFSLHGNEKLENLIEIFDLIQHEYLIDNYVNQTQIRLLRGLNPLIEKSVANKMIDKMGLGCINKLNNCINSYLVFGFNEYEIENQSEKLQVVMLKHVKGFWDFPKDSINLPNLLKMIETEMIANEKKSSREKIRINYKLSPITIQINNSVLKMPTDMYVIIHYCYEAPKMISIEELKQKTSSDRFDFIFQKLLEIGILRIDSLGCVSIGSFNDERSFIDLFEIYDWKVKPAELDFSKTHKMMILEAKICYKLKRIKKCSFEELKLSFIDEEELQECISKLITKGFLIQEDSNIEYVP